MTDAGTTPQNPDAGTLTGRSTVSTDWSFHGLQALVLRNEHLTVVVLPGLGGKVWEIHDQLTGRQLLWHHPRLTVQPVPFGAGYDDVFHGGWDELFPNDVPETIDGEPYPDHGETWTLPWAWTVVDDGSTGPAAVRLEVATPISACRLTKTYTLEPGARSLRMDVVVANEGPADLPFMWKQHLALTVDDAARIDLPAGRMRIDDFGSPRAGGPGVEYDWPVLVDEQGEHDMRPTLPVTSRRAEFQQAMQLHAGWCALTHADGSGIGIAFDPEVFRSCWLFASYGGWRNLQVAILEPCTGYPLSVNDGVAAGTHRTLAAGSRIATTLRMVVFDGLSAVSAIHPDGRVEGTPR
jgi:hypothetical protein